MKMVLECAANGRTAVSEGVKVKKNGRGGAIDRERCFSFLILYARFGKVNRAHAAE